MMTYIPTPQRTPNQRVSGEFYPLQKQELIALRQAKLINNAAFVHLALRYENPWCDRPIEIIPKEFARRWQLPESSVYEALGKLKKLGVLLLKTGQVVIEWVRATVPLVIGDSQQAGDSENRDPLRDSRSDSELPEKILESQKKFRSPRIPSELPENRGLELLKNQASDSPKTLQTLQTHQTEAAGEKNLSPASEVNGQDGGVKPDEANEQERESKQDDKIPQDLINKLEELEIPLDGAVRKALASHPISQAYGAARHVEDTWETINNPRAVFLYQLPKQPMEKAKQRLAPEFLDWYRQAVADGVVEDVPPEWLPTNYQNEPMVRLSRPDPFSSAPYTLVEWRRLQREPDYEPNQNLASLASLTELLEPLKRGRKGDG
jgi:hypothetical protein